MDKEWISGSDGHNLKFKREALLNYAMGRWALNKAHSVGSTSELIRNCAPKSFDDWEKYYFDNAIQKKINGIKVTKEYIRNVGQKLYIKITEVVHKELEAITEEECIDFAYNLVINRTYEGYKTEIQTIYGQLESTINYKIEPASDEWDRVYGVDFFIKINNYYIGLQIKPVSGQSLNHYQWDEMHRQEHKNFQTKFGGRVFFIYSIKDTGKKKKIVNTEVIEEIKNEIVRLKALKQ